MDIMQMCILEYLPHVELNKSLNLWGQRASNVFLTVCKAVLQASKVIDG